MADTRTDTQTAAGERGVAHEVERDAVGQDPATEQLARRLQKVSLVESPEAIENLIAEHSLLEDMSPLPLFSTHPPSTSTYLLVRTTRQDHPVVSCLYARKST